MGGFCWFFVGGGKEVKARGLPLGTCSDGLATIG